MIRKICLALLFLVTIAGCRTTNSGPIYRVKIVKGDTLAAIARKYDTSWQSIARLNQLTSASHIRVGQIIRLQPGPGGLVAGSQQDRIDTPATDTKSFDAKENPVKKEKKGLLFDSANSRVLWPLDGKITSNFGKRWGRKHAGIDIKGHRGKKFSAAASGRVKFVGRQSGYGKTIVIQHHGFETLYAHCTKILVNNGDWVAQGDAIGTVGSTGRATGPHLHFEIRKRGRAFDPLAWLGSLPST